MVAHSARHGAVPPPQYFRLEPPLATVLVTIMESWSAVRTVVIWLQTTDAKEHQRDKDSLTAPGEDLSRSVGCSAFRAVKETQQSTTTDAAAADQRRSTTDRKEHDRRWTYRSASRPSNELSAKSSSSSSTSSTDTDVSGLKRSSQFPNVEPDNNNNNTSSRDSAADKRPVRRADKDAADFSARLSQYVANCFQATAASDKAARSNDVYGECRSQTSADVASHEDRMTVTSSKQASNSILAAETALLDDVCSQTVFTSNESESDVVQQLNQSLVDPREDTGSQSVSEFQRQEPDDELGQPFSPASSASNISEYEQLASYDADIPEIPVSHIRLTPDECEALNQQLAIGFEVVGKASGTAGQEIVETGHTEENAVCGATDSQSVSLQGGGTCPESTSEAASVDKAQKDADVDVCDVGDSDQVAEALREAQLPSGPLDLTCSSRVHSTSDADVATATGQDVASTGTATTYSNSVPVNVYHGYQTSMSTFSRWSVPPSVTGWPPRPLPYYGHPGMYPGPCPPSMFPGMQWPFPGTDPFETEARSRGTTRRRRRAPSSCSRVDGIRSTKVAAVGGPSENKDKVSRSSRSSGERKRSKQSDKVPRFSKSTTLTTGAQDQEVCPSTKEVSAQPSATTTADADHITTEHVDVPTSTDNYSAPPVPDDVRDPLFISASSDNSVAARGARTQSRGGRRHTRAPRNFASDQLRQQEDGGSPPPPVRGRKRGRPRKRRGGGDDRTDRLLPPESGVETVQFQHKDKKSRRTSTRGSAPTRRRGRPRKSQPETIPTDAHSTAAELHEPCPTVIERTETCETSQSRGDDSDTDCGHQFELRSQSAGWPIATSGAIIRKPRSRKQGCRVQTSRPTAGPAEDRPGDELAGSWQPLVSEPTITSLLDRLSITAPDHDVPGQHTATSSADSKLQPNASTPFVMLERADLNRCVEDTFISIF